MKAVVRHNGQIVPEAMCLVDTSPNGLCVILETKRTPSKRLDMDRGFVEVHIWGILENMED